MYCDSFATSRYYATFGVSVCSGYSCGNWPNTNNSNNNNTFPMALSGSRNVMLLLLYVRFLKINCSQTSGCQEDFRNM